MTSNHVLSVAAAAGLIFCGAPTAFAQANVDLNAWSEVTNGSNGFWDVDDDGVEGSGPNGTFVRQEINGAPTIFLSPDNFSNTQINGTFSVAPNSDNDFIGFVFGVQSLNASSIDALLFDWKQSPQSGASEGFRLSRVTGNLNNSTATSNPFWTHTTTTDTTFQPLGTNFDSDFGWLDDGSTVYDFSLDYSTSNIAINIAGGQFGAAGLEVFNVDAASAPDVFPGGEFPDGQFGFYNFSQEGVIYESFTRTDDPVLATTPGDGGTLDFGNVRVTGSTSGQLEVVNVGGPGSTLSGTAPTPTEPVFSRSTTPDTFSLAEGGATSFDYEFAPITRGTFTDTVNVNANDPADLDGHDVTLMGTGVGPVYEAVDTADFGDVDRAETASLFITLSNVTSDGDLDGLTDLTLNDILVDGDDAGLFSLIGFTPGTSIAASNGIQIEVQYAGDGTLGPLEAVLQLDTDVDALLAGDGVDFQITLTANAVPEPAAAVMFLGLSALAWNRRPRLA